MLCDARCRARHGCHLCGRRWRDVDGGDAIRRRQLHTACLLATHGVGGGRRRPAAVGEAAAEDPPAAARRVCGGGGGKCLVVVARGGEELTHRPATLVEERVGVALSEGGGGRDASLLFAEEVGHGGVLHEGGDRQGLADGHEVDDPNPVADGGQLRVDGGYHYAEAEGRGDAEGDAGWRGLGGDEELCV